MRVIANLRESLPDGSVVEGFVASRFESAADAFLDNFRAGHERGASFAIRIGSDTAVDLWGGFAEAEGERPWTRDTVGIVFSCTKGATALCAHVLASRGLLDLDAPVGELWPEFAQAGKETVTTRMMLDHSAGVPALREKARADGVFDWDYMIGRLAAEAPFWQPGTRNGYHGLTFGWTVGEMVRRASGKSLGRFFQDDIAGPLGLDFWIGLPQEVEPRVAPTIPRIYRPEEIRTPFLQSMVHERNSIPNLFHLLNGKLLTGGIESRAGHAAELGAANGITNARGLAGMYAPLASGGGVDGIRLVDETTLARMGEVSMATHDDATLRIPTRFSLGFMKSMDNRRRSVAPKLFGDDCVDSVVFGSRAFGHVGAGGSLGFADPDCGLAFGYSMNRLGPGLLMNRRGQALVDATYRCLGYRSRDGGVWVR